MNLGIFIANDNRNWGPGKLSYNTIKGLQYSNINYSINKISDYNLCLCGDKFAKYFLPNKIENTIIGPCSLNIPSDSIDSFVVYEKFLVASQWYMNFWKTFGVTNVDFWYGGIDTEFFCDKKNSTNRCFIYFKNRLDSELKMVIEILNELKIDFSILYYGNYTEDDFIFINNNSQFGIILSNTETQGFAIMESLSMNTPLFVLDKNNWFDKYFDATSVPYFSEDCGFIVKENDFQKDFIKERLLNFILIIKHFEPRKFIEQNYSILNSTNLLIKKFQSI